jgi:uncharacterized membrane protein
MIKLLSLILLILLLLIGGKRGLKTFITIYVNLFLIIILIIIFGWGFDPLIPTFVISIIISCIILFLLNKVNIKTICSFISVLLILIIFFGITILINNRIYIQGYTEENIESISYVTFDTGLNMMNLGISIVIIGLIGNIIDTSIAVSSALYEVHINNPKLTMKELFISGMNIGKDILGTTTNTLFFAYLGSCMTLFIYFQDFQYSFSAIINSKIFAIEFTRILLSGTASFLIIPLTAIITAYFCIRKDDSNEETKNTIRRQKPSSNRKRASRSNSINTKRKSKNAIS